MNRNCIVAALLTAVAVPAFAQTGIIQRNVNQQQRIEQGLESGQLNTREAGRLEREQARALRDGNLTTQEKARIAHMQNHASRDIYRQKHDAHTGDPNSLSSQRMRAGVQRGVNQHKRIAEGARSGALTNREVARLERGQAHDSRLQARAAVDGRVGPVESRRLQQAQSVQSKRIDRQKHDAQTK